MWALCGLAIDGLLRLAHAVASSRGAVALIPSMPGWAFALMVGGGLWLCLWTGRIRGLGLFPSTVGAIGAAMSPSPDLLVTGDASCMTQLAGGLSRAGSPVRARHIAEVLANMIDER